MKRLVSLLMLSSVLLMSSCGGGWNDEKKQKIKNDCIADGGYDCDCYVKKTVETFKTPEDYNNRTAEAKESYEEALKDCEKEVEENNENIESF